MRNDYGWVIIIITSMYSSGISEINTRKYFSNKIGNNKYLTLLGILFPSCEKQKAISKEVKLNLDFADLLQLPKRDSFLFHALIEFLVNKLSLLLKYAD